MAKIKPYDITGAEDSPANEAEALAVAQNNTGSELATRQDSMGVGIISGDVDSEDILIPRLNIVQGVGPLSELYQPGQIVFNKETVLSDGNTPIELTVLSAKKQFAENLPFDSDERPRVFNTLEEVHEAGGSIEWKDDEKPSFTPILHAQLLLKAPAGAEGAFPLEYKGQPYALALWTLRGVAYTRAGRNILTAARFSLRDGIHHGKWTLSTKREKFGRNSVFVPVLRNVGRHDADFLGFVAGLVG